MVVNDLNGLFFLTKSLKFSSVFVLSSMNNGFKNNSKMFMWSFVDRF